MSPVFPLFPLHKSLLRAIGDLGYTNPTPIQEEVIPAALEGVDLRISAETGSGKTAAFLLPTLHRLLTHNVPGGRPLGPRALVLVPTRELAHQVHRVACDLGRHTNLHIALICGAEPFDEQMAELARLPDLLIATPGRLEKHLRLGAPDLSDLQTLILDEADRTLDMGLSEQVMAIVQRCNRERQTLLCSATLGHKGLRGLADALLREPQEIALNTVRERHSAIHHQLLLADDLAHKDALLHWLLANERYDRAVVFTNSRQQANRVGGILQSRGQRCGVLHGDMDQAQRDRVMALLDEGAFNVLVATDVAARGLDIAGVDLVINFELPRRGEIYLHRSGRTGRAGHSGTAISLVAAPEWNLKASLERYLRQHFTPRVIAELKGSYSGPKQLKASGKAARKKKRRKDTGNKANTAPARRAGSRKKAPAHR